MYQYTVPFHSICHRALCVMLLMKFWFCHIKKLLWHIWKKKLLSSQFSSKNYYYLTKTPNKFIQIWLSKYYFVNLLHDAWQMLRFVNVTWPVMRYMPNWMKCYSILVHSKTQNPWCCLGVVHHSQQRFILFQVYYGTKSSTIYIY